MKTKTLLLVVALTISFNIFAQQTQVWVKGGLNLGAIDGTSSDDIYGLVNLHAGIYASHDFIPTTGVQLEALMSTLETVVYEEINTSTGPYLNPKHTTLSYLSLPLLLRLHISRRLVLNAGGQYSILFGKNKRLTNSDTDAFKNGNWSLVFGVQVALGKRMQVYARYNPGLSSTGFRTTGSWFNNRGKTSRVIQLGFGYRIFQR